VQLDFVFFRVRLELNYVTKHDLQRTVLHMLKAFKDVGFVETCELLPVMLVFFGEQKFTKIL